MADILAYGYNHYLPVNSVHNSIHAEHDAINKLPIRKNKKIEKVNLMVIRSSKTGVLGMSKPCEHCINTMRIKALDKGYYISKIYYSDIKGNIIKTSIWNLLEEEKYTSSFYRYKNKM